MKIKYVMTLKNGELGRATVRFDNTGQGFIDESDANEIKNLIIEALKTPIKSKKGEVRGRALATVPVLAQPGTPEHAMAMVNPPILIEKGVLVESIEGDPFKI